MGDVTVPAGGGGGLVEFPPTFDHENKLLTVSFIESIPRTSCNFFLHFINTIGVALYATASKNPCNLSIVDPITV